MHPQQVTTILQTYNLAIGYATRKDTELVAKDINLSLEKGQLVSILGKNGAGKSTLLRTLSKVQPKLSGTIEMYGENIENLTNDKLAKKMSLVLTERIPDNNLTVYELIALGRQPYTNWIGKLTPTDYQYIDKAIAQTHLENILAKKHYELSDGQIQKVMIAKSLAQNTEIITLDEPTAHLDIENKVEIFKLLKKLTVKLKKTVLISTHEIHLALQLSDSLWLMQGQSVSSGSTEELIGNGSVSKLFDSGHIHFDRNSGQFIFD